MAGRPLERRRQPRADDPDLNGRRSEPRALIGLRTRTEMLSGRGNATLVNLSCAGARLEGAGLPAVGRDVLLTCGDLEIFGTVLWADEGRCGVRFDEPIERTVLSELRRTAATTAPSQARREELEAAADWVNGLTR